MTDQIETERPPRKRFVVYTTSGEHPCVEVWAEDWGTEGTSGAVFTNGGDVVALFRSGYVLAVVDAELADERTPRSTR